MGGSVLVIEDTAGNRIGYITKEGLVDWNEDPVTWLAQDTCDLDKVRLVHLHLDGTPVTVDEYDGIHRFIRLWRKLGWTIDETDKALTGVTSKPAGNGSGNGASGTSDGAGTEGEKCDFVGFDAFVDTCATDDDNGDGCGPDDGPTDDDGCPDPITADHMISPEFLHQLVAVKKLLDLTGLPLIRLLAFWADISIAGEKPLYSKLFLTHNLLGIDKVFKPDAHGNYLTQAAKITEHLPVLMAALRLKADDITAILAFPFLKLTDALTLRNVTVLYRYSLLAKILHVRIPELAEVIALFGNPFKSAYHALDFLTLWGRMEDAGFTFRQMNYLIVGHDDSLRPLAPAKKTILQISKTLYDGLNVIDRDHHDVKPDLMDIQARALEEGVPYQTLIASILHDEDKKEQATAELIRTKAGLLYEQAVVEQILGLLEGTTVYTTNAPANQTIKIPDTDTLARKLKYSNQKDAVVPKATIQVTGVLTDSEKTQAKALSAHPKWAEAIDRVSKQTKNVFNNVLFGIFSDKDRDDAIKNLLAPDINLLPDPKNPSATDANTAPAKRFYFLMFFLPFLRRRLAQRLIVDTLSGASGLANDITSLLLSDVLVVGTTPQPAMSALEKIKDKPPASASGWAGYLIPSADAEYAFVAIGDTQPPPLILDGETRPFVVQQEDPSNVWSTDPATPAKLKSGKLYWLEVSDRPADQLEWRTSSSPSAPIPSSALLPDFSSQGTEEVFIKLTKAALLINGFNLSVDEISYWQTHGTDFAADAKTFDFNLIRLGHWRRLQAYTDLRNNLPRFETTLLDLFAWASKPNDASKLSEEIAAVSGWKKDNIDKLLKAEHFDLDRPEAFRNEVNLVKLRTAIVVADKIGMDIDRLFDWARPGSKFWLCHQIAEDIRKAIRARFDQEDWEQVVKPLNDQLREHQKQALISYLLVQPDLIDWGVVDADSLFEFFLIDVQMDACMETSRIKQAISSVQLFIQRCLLGLEEEHGVPIMVEVNGKVVPVLDRDRWEWMQRYRVWEANRKVFLYPENWILSELRDDKSPFYKELESELLQKDINKQTVEDALKNYLFKVDEVANLKVVSLFLDEDGEKLHIFSRTRNAPYFFYYRYFHTGEKNWYSWEKVQVDIPSYDLESTSGDQVSVTDNGAYLIPVVWNNRLLIFFPQFLKKTAPRTSQIKDKTIKAIGDDKASDHKPIEYWEIKMGWSEYRNRKWTQKQVSAEAVYQFPIFPPLLDRPIIPIDQFRFTPRIMTGANPQLALEVFSSQGGTIKGFVFSGSQMFRGDAATTAVPDPTNFHVYPNVA